MCQGTHRICTKTLPKAGGIFKWRNWYSDVECPGGPLSCERHREAVIVIPQ